MLIEANPETIASGLVQEMPTRFRVNTRVYTDPAIFSAEMRSIFEKTWVYVAHESEVAQPGDYRTSTIGQQPVIVSRGEDHAIRVFLNVCRHRGNAVCREERGNSSNFRCPYHGWVYSQTGALIGVSQRNGYPDDFDEAMRELNLMEVPRVAIYRGLVFASLNAEGQSIEEHLGPTRKYIDLWAEMSPVGTLRVSRPHAYSYYGNWKFQIENGVDGYHARFVHQSAFNTLEKFGTGRGNRDLGQEPGCTRGFERGHCMLERPGLRGGLTPQQLEEYRALLVERYGAERADLIMTVRHIQIFPNLCLMDANIRVIQPIAVDKTAVYSYRTWPDGVPEDINAGRFRDLQRRLGTTGLIGTDDVEMFAGNQSGMQATAMEWIVLDRGLHREVLQPDGEREGWAADETPQRAIYRGWAQLMNGATG
jgi:phenylpropionate dioxygenase-like ring-hydroxylating dioxygenase large terminal subunit